MSRALAAIRIYNPSIGKFLSVDPLTKSYPMLTPYQFASNTPIQAIDVDGLEAYHFSYVKGDDGKPELTLFDVKDIYSYNYDLLGYLHGGPLMNKSVDNSKQEYYIHDYYQTFGLLGKETHDKATKFKSFEELEKADPSTTNHNWHEKLSQQIVAAASYSMPSSSSAKVGSLKIPHGFKSLGMIKQFATQIQAGLSRLGFKNTKIYLQGSAVKGADDAGRAFDVGRKSDFDVALTGDDIWNKAESLGITSTTKSSVIKSGSDEAINLGIDDLLNQVSNKFGRPVDVMIFKNVEEVKRKGASIRLVSEIERK